MYLAAVCEHRMERASKERNEKLEETQRKLDQFYYNMDLVKQQQVEGAPVTKPLMGAYTRRGNAGEKEVMAARDRTDSDRMKIPTVDEGEEEKRKHLKWTDTTSFQDPGMELGGKDVGLESGSLGESLDLEQALDQALCNDSDSGTNTGDLHSSDMVDEDTKKPETPQTSNFEQLDKPLPPVESVGTKVAVAHSFVDSDAASKNGNCCLHEIHLMFIQFANKVCREPGRKLLSKEKNETLILEGEDCDNHSLQYKEEVLMLGLIEVGKPVSPTAQDPMDRTKLTLQRDYLKSEHYLEFPPYSPLPDQLEKLMFPSEGGPRPTHNDPYWPMKKECLELAQNLRTNPGLAGYSGTFIAPGARGVRYMICQLIIFYIYNFPSLSTCTFIYLRYFYIFHKVLLHFPYWTPL